MKGDKSGPTDWRQLREFSAVDLDKSFILSWHVDAEMLMIDIDLHLTPDHPFYEKPRPAEQVLFQPAIIEFPFCEQITVDSDTASSVSETAERLGHGAIEGLRRHEDGRYEISGVFGTVLIVAERLLLRLKGP